MYRQAPCKPESRGEEFRLLLWPPQKKGGFLFRNPPRCALQRPVSVGSLPPLPLDTNYAIVVFPGTWSERDWHAAITDVLGETAEYVFHKEEALAGADCVVLPGGFSYGDYLRPGAIARFSPIRTYFFETV